MTRSFYQYPTGMVGLGFLLLRLTVATGLGFGATLLSTVWTEVTVIAIAILLALGAFTAVIGVLGLFAAVLIAVDVGGQLGLSALLQGAVSLGISMTGAGGYSLDAQLFGRKVISLD